MTFTLWFVGIYLGSVYVMVRLCKRDGQRIEEKDLLCICSPIINTVLLIGVYPSDLIELLLKLNSFQCFLKAYKSIMVKLLNKL